MSVVDVALEFRENNYVFFVVRSCISCEIDVDHFFDWSAEVREVFNVPSIAHHCTLTT